MNLRRRVPVRLQLTSTECGAACLAMIVSYHGKPTRVADCRTACAGGRDGVTLALIATAARGLGLNPAGFFVAPDAFDRVRLPAIAHWKRNHFVIVERWSEGAVEIIDPALGRRRMPAAEFRAGFSGCVLTLTPAEGFVGGDAPRSRAVQRAAIGLLRTEWPTLARILAASLMLQLVGLALPLLTQVLIDGVRPLHARGLLGPFALAVLALALTQASITGLRGLTLASLQARLDARLMAGFVDHLLRLPIQFFAQRSDGDILMRLSSNAVIREMLSGELVSVILDGAFIVVYLIVLLWRSPALAVTAAAAGGLQIALVLITAARARVLMQASLAAQAEAQSYLAEAIAALPTLKASGCEDVALGRWLERFGDDVRLNRARSRMAALIDAGMSGLRVGAPLALLLVGIASFAAGAASLGTVLGLTALATAVLVPLGSLASTIQRLGLAAAGIERIVDVLDHPIEQHGSRVACAPVLAGAIELRNVGFGYARAGAPVVRGISLSIRPGEHVALVGPTGSGKSTLAMLMLGLFEPTEGAILFDGIPLRDLDLSSVRRQCGVVMQEPAIFSGSIRDNLAFGRDNVSFEMLTRCARLAAVDDDIERLPMRYETHLGERGAGFSGGQRQRIALARALAREPRIVLLDEATSHLDAVTERRIHERLRELRCTRIVIAHRLSTVRDADRIVVIENGAIAESGTHDALLRAGGRYAELVGRQTFAVA